jgi:glucuronate isomerase
VEILPDTVKMENITNTSFFITEDFLLQTKLAKELYHDYAKDMPIIDYHCHIPPDEIAGNKVFENMSQIWLYGDHYKWRAMRTLGVNEHYITGTATDEEKFMKWADTVPYTMRNPLYHWTHMELLKPFGIKKVLNTITAEEIYSDCNYQLKNTYSTQNIIDYFKVDVLCTTDDPADTLDAHKYLASNGFNFKVYPAFRPDKAMEIQRLPAFRKYVEILGETSNISIKTYADYLDVLKSKHDYFHTIGCRLSDHGLKTMYAADFTENDIQKIFAKALSPTTKVLTGIEILKFKSAMLLQFAEWDFEKEWVQQFHLGALRNNNRKMAEQIGADSGFDSIGDFPQAVAMAKFFNKLDRSGKLAKTIIYNLNPSDNEVFASMIGNFNDGSIQAKMQWGSAWWFLDQKDGMEKQITALSNIGLLSQFVGMLTDSRSFLSYSRHEYFRRLLCNLFATDVVNNELPDDRTWIGKLIQDICYYNAKRFFNW